MRPCLAAETGEQFEHEVDLARRVVVGDADPQGAARVYELQPRDQLGRVMAAVSRKDLVPRQPALDGLRSMGRPGQRHAWHPLLELRRYLDPVVSDSVMLP